MRQQPGTTGPSLVAAEQFGHDVCVRSRAGTPRGYPLVVCGEGSLDLRLFQDFDPAGRAALAGTESAAEVVMKLHVR